MEVWSVLNCVVFIFRYKAGNVQPGEVSQSEPEDRGGRKELRRARRGARQRRPKQAAALHEGEAGETSFKRRRTFGTT